MSMSKSQRRNMIDQMLKAQDSYELLGLSFGHRYSRKSLMMFSEESLTLEVFYQSNFISNSILKYSMLVSNKLLEPDEVKEPIKILNKSLKDLKDYMR